MIEKPWTLKVEFSRGCNLSCKFCPIHASPEKYADHTFMEPALLDAFATQYGKFAPRTRIELTLRGEPTLNPNHLELLQILRYRIPECQISMFTNGVKILKDPLLLIRLFESGVNILNIDCYNDTYERFKLLATEVIGTRPIQLKDFREFSAYKRHPGGERLAVLTLVPDIADADVLVKVRVLHNNAGNSSESELEKRWGILPVVSPLKKGCTRPFREFVFYSNGNVVICCHDWNEDSVVGSFPKQSVEEIWQSETHKAVLRSLYAKDRSGRPCDKCDYSGGYRQGLLKDPDAVA